MNKIITKITSLLATKKLKIVAGVLAVALITGGAFAITNVVSANTVWAVLLNYFGQASVTGNVWQSVLLDGGRYNEGDDTRAQSYTTSDIFAGETTRSIHDLENRSSVEQKVKLVTSYSPESIASYITTTYWKALNYDETIDISGYSIPATVTVKALGDSVEWTIDMDETVPAFDNGHAQYGLIISTDNVKPAFQVHSNDGTCLVGKGGWVAGTHLYSAWDDTIEGNYNGWNTGGEDCEFTNTPAINEGIIATGEYSTSENTGAVFTIAIPKTHLGNEKFYWAMQLMGNTVDTQYPNEWVKWSGNATTFATATLEERIWNGNVTLQPNETMDFVMSNKTANNLVCSGCTVTVTVEPR